MKTIFFICLSFLFFNNLYAINLKKYPLEDENNFTKQYKTALDAFKTVVELIKENRRPKVYQKQIDGHTYLTPGILLTLQPDDIEYPHNALLEPYPDYTLAQNKGKRHIGWKKEIEGTLLFAKYTIVIKTHMRECAKKIADQSKIWIFSFYKSNKHIYSCMWCEKGWANLNLDVNDASYIVETPKKQRPPRQRAPVIEQAPVYYYYGPIIFFTAPPLYPKENLVASTEGLHLEAGQNELMTEIKPLTQTDLMDLGISEEPTKEEIELSLNRITKLTESWFSP